MILSLNSRRRRSEANRALIFVNHDIALHARFYDVEIGEVEWVERFGQTIEQ